MSRGLDLATTNRNIVSKDSELASVQKMTPLLLSSVTTPNENIVTPDNTNSLMIGPITIDNSISITIGAGGTLTII